MPSLLLLIIQLVTILLVARITGWLFRKLGQPQVVGEMFAGILLGPSLLGWAAPGITAALFPQESLGPLNALSQVGLLVFMFLVGLELDRRLLREMGRTAIVVSHISIVAPFCLGVVLALYLYPRLADQTVAFTGFALFMGAAMSVTAFPVLARILVERNLQRTRLGTITIACAAVGDLTAWYILAVIVAFVHAAAYSFPLWMMLIFIGAYIGLMLFGVRPLLQRVSFARTATGDLSQDKLALILLVALASSGLTEWLGVHALFGAFFAGVIMPKNPETVDELRQKLEPVVVVLLLPLFFAYTGLRTSIRLISGLDMFLYGVLIMVAAVGGKLGGSMLAARFTGMRWREATALGILMNTRGLVELVILNIGLDIGVLSPRLFSIMVMMALLTTVMTSPLLSLVYRGEPATTR